MADATHPAAPDPEWDEWEAPVRGSGVPVLHLDGFDGPMDLLLDLAERQRIDLGRLSIADLATQFVAAMEQLAGQVPIEQRADWLVLAAQLVLLRARLLAPHVGQADGDGEGGEAATLRRLGDRLAMRAAAAWLQARPQLGLAVFTRPAAAAAPPEGGYVALMEACLPVLRGPLPAAAAETVYRPAPPLLWRVDEAVRRITRLLQERPQGGALGAFLPGVAADAPQREVQARAAVASTFSAGLELARQQAIRIEQQEAFETIQFRAAGAAGGNPAGRNEP